jgi:acetyltransferase-like isoleucine patch superfamily enzyme
MKDPIPPDNEDPCVIYDHINEALITHRDLMTDKDLFFDHKNTVISIGVGTILRKGVKFFLRGGKVQIAERCTIGEMVDVSSGSSIRIQDGVKIDRFVGLRADDGELTIGSNTIVGQASQLWAHTGNITLDSRNSLGRFNDWIGTGQGISVAEACDFGQQVTIDSAGGFISIAKRSGVGPSSILYGHGGLQIGAGCAIAGLTMIIPGNHIFDMVDVPLRQQGVKPMPIVIGNDVWIGAGVVVLGHSSIGNGAVIGAGAVVTGGHVDERTVVVGVPARDRKRN